MKKCPFCGAQIEDNARFCLYCMTSLEDKQVIDAPKEHNKRWLYILAAVLAFAVIGCCIWAFAGKDAPSDASVDPDFESQITSKEGSDTATNSEPATDSEPATNPDAAKNNSSTTAENPRQSTGSPTNKQSAPSGGNGQMPNASNSGSSTATNNKNDTSSSNTPANNTESTDTNHNSNSNTSTAADDKSNGTDSENSSADTPTPPVAASVTYTYRNAKYGDDFSVSANLGNCVVITGVSTASANGEYIIPATIDGKKVIAIMGLAFCDDSIKDTVKKVVVPSTVKTIWNYAFANCYNLTDIYFCGNSIYTEAKAFADSSKRTGTLTIHCSAACNDRNFRYYKNSASNYDALYREWNG